MSTSTYTSFREALQQSSNQVGLSIMTLLAWIATSDGRLSQEEKSIIHELASSHIREQELNTAFAAGKQANVSDLKVTCQFVRLKLDEKHKKLFIKLAISTAVADGYLSVTENHILSFLADLVGLASADLEYFFEEFTNRPLPPPGDPSTVDWWAQREQNDDSSKRTGDSDREGKQSPRSNSDDLTYTQAYAILGLEEGVGTDEIRSAYRRIVHVHHPDKYSSLGPEAVAAATVTFKRIQRAYELLAQI